VAKRKDTAGLKLVTEDAQDVEKKFRDLYDRANTQSPAAGVAAARLRELLTDHPGERLWQRIPSPLKVAEDFALEHSPGITPGVRVCWRVQLADMRRELAGENPSKVESLLAQHAALCWLRLAEVEVMYSAKLGDSHTLTLGAYYDKRLTMAQRRFTRACETLERVRMMRRRAGLGIVDSAEGERRRA
jgi:hypothetical protein